MKKILFFAEGQLGDSLVLMPALRAVRKALPEACITVLMFYRAKYESSLSPLPANILRGHASKGDSLVGTSELLGAAEVYKDNPFVDEVFEVDRNVLRSLKGLARLKAELVCVRFLRKQKFDAVVCTFPEDRFAIWSFLARIPVRIGQKKQAFSFLLTHKPDLDERSEEGVVRYLCGLMKPLGAECSDYQPYYQVPETARRWADIFFAENHISSEKVICIHPGARDPDKQWHPEGYAELLSAIENRPPLTPPFQGGDMQETDSSSPLREKTTPLPPLSQRGDTQEVNPSTPNQEGVPESSSPSPPSKGDLRVMVCYSDYDIPYIEKIRNAVLPEERIIWMKTGKVSQLAALFERSSLCVVHSSGPRHLAAAVGARTLALFKKREHIMWKVYEQEHLHYIVQSSERCRLCGKDECRGLIPEGEVYAAQCMRDIKAEEVMRRIGELVNR